MRRADDYQGLGRHYQTPMGWLPSVSTVLRATGDNSRLEAWRDRVGREYADAIRDSAAARGARLHAEIEDALLFGRWPGNPSPWLLSIEREVREALDSTDRVAELPVWSRKYGYAGTLDLTGVAPSGRRVVWDWKTYLPSNEEQRANPRPKDPKFCEDHLLQTRAYAKALGSSMFQKVDELRVVIARCAVRKGRLVTLPGQILTVTRESIAYARLWYAFELRLGLWKVYRSTMVA